VVIFLTSLPHCNGHHGQTERNMATKATLIADILKLEPNNEIANRTKVYHEALSKELVAAKRRAQEKETQKATPAEVRYRTEGDTLMCWELVSIDTDDVLGVLSYGDQLPFVGNLVSVGEGQCARITRHVEGLEISAGHLSVREKFDARRVYTTPNDTRVTYKREEKGRVVLWSYKLQGEIAIGRSVKLKRTGTVAKPTAAARKKMTQKIYAAWAISQNPDITNEQMTAALQEAFPQAAIGDRHGPHYISLSINGHLPEAPETDPRTWGK
jgi:hypothetical protein